MSKYVCFCVCAGALLVTLSLFNLQEGSWSNWFYAIVHQPEIILFVGTSLKAGLQHFVFQQRCVRQNIQSDVT